MASYDKFIHPPIKEGKFSPSHSLQEKRFIPLCDFHMTEYQADIVTALQLIPVRRWLVSLRSAGALATFKESRSYTWYMERVCTPFNGAKQYFGFVLLGRGNRQDVWR